MQWFSVTMCYYGLSFASTSLSSGGPYLNYMLRWHSSENPTISKRKPTTDLVSHNSVMIEIPGYLFCIFVMDCWGRRPILSFCQVVINALTRRWLFSVRQFSCYRLYLALPASSVASCKDRLIQTSRICRWAFTSFQNPLFKGVEWKNTSNLRSSSPCWASLGLQPPSPLSTSTLPSSFLQLWGSCFLGKQVLQEILV